MVLENTKLIDNIDGNFNKVYVSTLPELDLITNTVLVKLYRNDPITGTEVVDCFTSTRRIFETNSKFNTIFDIPLNKYYYFKTEYEFVSKNDETKKIEFLINLT